MTIAGPGPLWLEQDKGGGAPGAPTTQDDDSAEDREDEDRILKCARCTRPIARVRDRITVEGKHQHTCVNPHGFIYAVGCFRAARGCALEGEESAFWSWFSGYTWQVAVCAWCLTHLGWRFRGPETTFWGFVLDRLVA